MSYCPTCGTEVKEDDIYCSKCRTNLKSNVTYRKVHRRIDCDWKDPEEDKYGALLEVVSSFGLVFS